MPRRLLFFLVIAGIAAISLSGLFLAYQLSPVSAEAAKPVEILVQKGDGFRTISQALFANGLIRSASTFRFYGLLTGRAHRLKPGAYDFSPASTTPEIIAALVRGPSPDVQILIPEGQTLADIDQHLTERGIIQKGALINFPVPPLLAAYPFLKGAQTLEGFLFPDTYRFYFDSPATTTVQIFLNNFKLRALPVLERNTKKIYDTLIIASILEKEVPETDDRLLVSGIIAKRLKIGMPLQVDASSIYARLQTDDRYDTYKNPGLPPGPISNPGLDAISAALHPKNSSYFYYLSDPKTGQTLFSKTFEEHDDKRALYLRSSR